MIEFIRLRNFQKWKKLRIDFSESTTSIIGPTDSGKSAVLRALRWVCFNRPAGSAFIRNGANFVSVTIGIDRHTITRKKSSKTNCYIVNGKQYKAFGSDVPRVVSRILSVSVVNFQRQHDNPFWFSESAGQVSKLLNQIVNLGQIDSAMKNILSEKRAARSTVEILSGQKKQAKLSVKRLKSVTEADAALKRLESLESAISANRSKIDSGVSILSGVERLTRDRKRAAMTARGAGNVVKIGGNLLKLRRDKDRLSLVLKNAAKHSKILKAELIGAADITEAAETAIMHKMDIDKIERLLSATIDAQHRSNAAAIEYETAEKKLERKTGNKCPICGRKKQSQ